MQDPYDGGVVERVDPRLAPVAEQRVGSDAERGEDGTQSGIVRELHFTTRTYNVGAGGRSGPVLRPSQPRVTPPHGRCSDGWRNRVGVIVEIDEESGQVGRSERLGPVGVREPVEPEVSVVDLDLAPSPPRDHADREAADA